MINMGKISAIIGIAALAGVGFYVGKKLIEKRPLHGNSASILQAFTTLGQALVYLLLCGYTSAFIMKRLAPDYSAEDYAKCSKAATLFAVPAMILSCILEQYIK